MAPSLFQSVPISIVGFRRHCFASTSMGRYARCTVFQEYCKTLPSTRASALWPVSERVLRTVLFWSDGLRNVASQHCLRSLTLLHSPRLNAQFTCTLVVYFGRVFCLSVAAKGVRTAYNRQGLVPLAAQWRCTSSSNNSYSYN